MKCPFCGFEDTRVVNSRPDREGNTIRRRRECDECHQRFTTYENREEITPFVVKKDGRTQPFDRTKLIRSIQSASSKRPVSQEAILAFVADLEASLQDQFRREIPSRELGDRVMAFLKAQDHVAYVRFASVYRDFRDVGEFVQAVTHLQTATDEGNEPPVTP
jgi:transcriptional repressor NrdR